MSYDVPRSTSRIPLPSREEAMKPDPGWRDRKNLGYCRIDEFIDEIEPTSRCRDRLKTECGLAARKTL